MARFERNPLVNYDYEDYGSVDPSGFAAPIETIQPIQPVQPAPTGVFGLPLALPTPVQVVQPIVQPVQPVDNTNILLNQILGQGLTGKWTGQGYGSAQANAADMAKILAGIGITDIKDFGKVADYETAQEIGKTYNGQSVLQLVDEQTGATKNVIRVPDGGVDEEGNPTSKLVDVPQDAKIETKYGIDQGEGNILEIDPSKIKTVDGKILADTGKTTFGNKKTGQAVPVTYSGRQSGNFFGGTYEGKGNTGYGVQFDAQGNPYFYTQGASSNSLANLLKDLGPIGQIAIAAATGGLSLPAQLAANAGIQLLAGGNLKDIAKGTALSYLGGQAGNLISGSSGITDLLGKTGSNIASRTAQQYIGSGGKADLEQALLGNALSTGVNSVIGEVPGLDSLSPVDKSMTSNLITAIATGTPIDQALQNALVGKASYEARNAVAQARNAPSSSAEQPQTYEDLMAGIEPRMSGATKPDTGPSNDEILEMINYDPSLINNAGVDTLGTKLAAEPATGRGRAMSDIDWSQIFGDYGDAGIGSSSLADELAKAGSSGNASSIFSGDGGIDLSGINWEGTVDAPAPPLDIAERLEKVTEGNEVDESFLYRLSPEERERYLASKEEGYESTLAGTVPQELGISQTTIDSFNKNYQPRGGFGSQWQTYGSDRIMINDDGTGIGINTETGNQYSLSQNQVKSMIANKMLNTKASGYVGATGGTGSTPGGSRPAASTAKKSTTAAGGKDNLGLMMALMAMMAMMSDRNKGGSSGAVIPSLQANRSQLPYAPVSSPGSPNVNYFSPTTYTAKAAEGGLMGLAAGGMSDLGGYSDGGRLLRGPGDGVSDSIPATIGGRQPARLAEGEFVVPARVVSELGNGSTNAGANKLYAMMDRVQQARRKTKNVAADTKAHKYLPA
jgi:hypothetical protein